MTVSMSAVWDRTAEFLSDHLGAIMPIAALPLFVPAAITEILTPLTTAGGDKLALWLFGALLMVPMLWGQLVITALALDPAVGPADARGLATRRLGATVLVTIAFYVVAFVMALPVVVVLIENGVDLTQLDQPGVLQNLPVGATALIGLYMLVAGPIALWLTARIAILATPVVAAENLALGALGRAYRLTRGLALRIIAVLALYGLVVWIATAAAKTVFGSIFSLLLDGTGPWALASILTALLVALVATIFGVLATVFCAKLYLAARDRAVAATT